MTRRAVVLLAFCMLAPYALGVASSYGATSSESANLARYADGQLAQRAGQLRLLAAVSYQRAILDIRAGDRASAENHLEQAIQFYPHYSDAYFTLARLRLLQRDIDAAVFLMHGVFSLWKDFRSQSHLLLNMVLLIPYVLIMVTLITCIGLGIKYLPFAAHKVEELLKRRFRALAPRFAAMLIVLLPIAAIPGVITTLAYVTLVGWMFMRLRERVLLVSLLAPFIALGFFGSRLAVVGPIADPLSLTSLIARSNYEAGTAELIGSLDNAPAGSLNADKSLALGLLYYKRGEYTNAAEQFIKSNSLEPGRATGYINLGNVYFQEGRYEKALEGYRKAEGIIPDDPVCQHDLAQAYIKTLLMQESSKALQKASSLGIEKVKTAYAPGALRNYHVFPKTFSAGELWRIATAEGADASENYLDRMLVAFTRFDTRTSAWILLAALVLALLLTSFVKKEKVTFQCSNCGTLTCDTCCRIEGVVALCHDCGQKIEKVTSEKVIDALLRQRRQETLLKRRQSTRFVTMLVPGIRDIAYGNIGRGVKTAVIFGVCAVQAVTRGYVAPDPMTIPMDPPLWELIVPVSGIVLTYVMSMMSKPRYDFRHNRAVARGDLAREVRDPASRVA